MGKELIYSMGKDSDWYKSKERRLNKQLQTILNEIPYFAKNYILSEITRLELKTLISYAYEIEHFLNFLNESQNKNNTETSDSDAFALKTMKLEVITELTIENAKAYIQYLRDTSGNAMIKRSIYILNNWFKYMISKDVVPSNPFQALEVPKFKIEDSVNHLSPEEIQEMFDSVIKGAGRSEHQEAYLKKTQLRDYTILLLILNTGIRVSECQGLDISDIDTENNRISIVRKGGKSATIYINQKVSDTLRDYIQYRSNMFTKFPDEKALFLSIRKTRMTIRSIEKLVAKLAESCLKSKKVTPTILRNTYGVELYKKTKNKELVGTMLDCVSTSARYMQTDSFIIEQEAEALLISEEVKKEAAEDSIE